MNPLLVSIARGARRAMREHQAVPPRTRLPLWRLLIGEFVWLLGRLWQPRRLLPAVAVVALVLLALGPATPGPVLRSAWRVVAAGVLGGAAAILMPALIGGASHPSSDDGDDGRQ